jgi:hypothetical protein
MALECWRLFGLRGYARVDFRCDETGQPWILEINPNPCLSPTSGFAAALDRADIGYDEGIQRILDAAFAESSLARSSRPHAKALRREGNERQLKPLIDANLR